MYTDDKDTYRGQILLNDPIYRKVKENNIIPDSSFNTNIDVGIEKTLNHSNAAFFHLTYMVSNMKSAKCKVSYQKWHYVITLGKVDQII